MKTYSASTDQLGLEKGEAKMATNKIMIVALAALILCFSSGTSGLAAQPAPTGSLYIASLDGSSATQGTVLEFDALTGQFKRTLVPSLGNEIIQGITLGPDRNLYLSVWGFSAQYGHVLRYNLDGKPLGEFIASGEGGLDLPIGLRFGPDGNLYVASNGLIDDKILRFNRSGRFRGALASNLDDITPEDIAFGPDGLLDVTMASPSSVYQYNTADNTFVGALVSAGAGGLVGPLGLAFGPDHNLYLASSFSNAVLRFNGSTGAFIDVFASVAAPVDLVFGPDGNLYVLRQSPGQVMRFDGTTGAFIDIFIGPGTGGLNAVTRMLFVDPGCSRYAENGFSNRCFPVSKQGKGK